MDRINLQPNQINLDYQRFHTENEEQQEDQQINSLHQVKENDKQNKRLKIGRLILIILFLPLCLIQPLLLYPTISGNQTEFPYLYLFYEFILFLEVLLVFLIRSRRNQNNLHSKMDTFKYVFLRFIGFGMIFEVFQNKITVQYYDCNLGSIWLRIFIIFERVQQTFNSNNIMLFCVHQFILSLFIMYLSIKESQDEDIEVLLNKYDSSLKQYLFQSLINLCFICYCFEEMNQYQIIILLMIKIAFMIFYYLKYKHFYFFQTFFNLIIDQQLYKKKQQMVINLSCIPYQYIQNQIKCMIYLGIVELLYILLNILQNSIKVNLLSIFLIFPIINLINLIKIDYDQSQQDLGNQNIDIFTTQGYQNFIEDFQSNPIKYKSLKNIFIERLDFQQALECVLYNFRKISIQFNSISYQNSEFIKIRRCNTINSQVIYLKCEPEDNFQHITINPENILPEITEIYYNSYMKINKFPFYQIIKSQTPIKFICQSSDHRIDYEPLIVYNNYYNTIMVKIIQNISFKKHISKYIPINPLYVFINLYEDDFFNR